MELSHITRERLSSSFPGLGIPQDPRGPAGLEVKIAASTVWEILKTSNIDPAPRRTGPTWSQFLHSQAEVILACDFFIVDLLDGTQAYVLATGTPGFTPAARLFLA